MNIHSLKTSSGKKYSRHFVIGLATTIGASMLTNTTLARPAPLVWDKLEFEGSKLLISLKAEISREKISAQQAVGELFDPEGYIAKQPTGEYVLKTHIKTDVLGNQSHFIAWQNPDLEVLQRTTLYSGFKNWYRNYRYLPNEAISLKIEPAPGESVDDWQQWSDIKQSINAYRPAQDNDQDAGKAPPLSESAAIFDILATDIIEKTGDKHTLHVFNRRGNYAVILHAVDQQSESVDFQQSIEGNWSRRKDKVNALVVRVDAMQLESDQKADDFKFMGYQGSINIYYDPLQNLPLKLNGKVEYAGNVEIRLEKARFVDSLAVKR